MSSMRPSCPPSAPSKVCPAYRPSPVAPGLRPPDPVTTCALPEAYGTVWCTHCRYVQYSREMGLAESFSHIVVTQFSVMPCTLVSLSHIHDPPYVLVAYTRSVENRPACIVLVQGQPQITLHLCDSVHTLHLYCMTLSCSVSTMINNKNAKEMHTSICNLWLVMCTFILTLHLRVSLSK
jgi:hypothetical protein